MGKHDNEFFQKKNNGILISTHFVAFHIINTKAQYNTMRILLCLIIFMCKQTYTHTKTPQESTWTGFLAVVSWPPSCNNHYNIFLLSFETEKIDDFIIKKYHFEPVFRPNGRTWAILSWSKFKSIIYVTLGCTWVCFV